MMVKESSKRSSIVLPCLLGLTMAYQVLFHFIVWQKMPADKVESSVMCWGSKGAAGQGNEIANQCAEVEVFQEWQASPELEFERIEDWTLTEPDLLMVNLVGEAKLNSSVSGAAQSVASVGLNFQSNSVEQPDRAKEASNSTVIEKKTESKNSTADSDHWAADLLSLQARMDMEMHRLTELHKVHMEHHQRSVSKMAPHEKIEKPELLSKIEDLQREMCADPRRKSHPTCVSFLSSHPVHHGKNSSEWIASLEAAQVPVKSKYNDSRQEATKKPAKGTMKLRKVARKGRSALIMEDLKNKMHDLDVGLEKIRHKHEVWEKSMASRAMALRVQMCSESHHKHNKACDDLWHQLNADQAPDQAEKKANAISEEPEVVADPLHLLHLPTLAPPPKKGSRFMKKTSPPPHQVLKSDDLRSKHWGGKIPKVACIMAIPMSNATSEDLKRQSAVQNAIDAFRSESYEGSKQLIVVYHFQDRQAAKLAKQNADGFLIKAIRARGEVPSTMALRFGAWESDRDADIVARWDIDSFHHPERLSMQVRALGYSGRPASVNMWGAQLTPDGKRSVIGEPLGLENSMVGLRSWMERNWHPFAGDHTLDHLAKVGDLVYLDTPELTHPTHQ